MYKENYVESLRKELVEIVAKKLSPVAIKYKYADIALESHIKWKPIVLILGNYSSGKSTLINEVLGVEVQKTGQAPTDDSFTVIMGASKNQESTVESRDGHVLLNDETYPFEDLKRHGQRFSSHFTLKSVKSPLLEHLSIIDTPGMLDSMSENDRGYPYQEVIGDLASRADLILVLFDPHKAGTVRESHASLRETLPKSTFEDRVLFVLNRIDECTNMTDLLRVYGTLCWNLSQMTGRKDIPMIHLTYSEKCSSGNSSAEYLKFFSNQRMELKKAIEAAPKHRLDHLASFTETHAERLSHLLEASVNYRRFFFRKVLKHYTMVNLCLIAAAVIVLFSTNVLDFDQFSNGDMSKVLTYLLAVLAVSLIASVGIIKYFFKGLIRKDILRHVDDLTELSTISRRDSWSHIKEVVEKLIESDSFPPRKEIRRDMNSLKRVIAKDTKEIRAGINEYAKTIKNSSF